jgi:hypothetical protein
LIVMRGLDPRIHADASAILADEKSASASPAWIAGSSQVKPGNDASFTLSP